MTPTRRPFALDPTPPHDERDVAGLRDAASAPRPADHSEARDAHRTDATRPTRGRVHAPDNVLDGQHLHHATVVLLVSKQPRKYTANVNHLRIDEQCTDISGTNSHMHSTNTTNERRYDDQSATMGWKRREGGTVVGREMLPERAENSPTKPDAPGRTLGCQHRACNIPVLYS